VQAHATAEPVRTDTAVGARDPLPGRYQLAATDFARCHLAGLRRDSLPGERLYDDGSHGDLAPDDGVYTLAFSATGLEGTRNFVFHMVGVTADGIGFARTRRLSRYVGVVPDPGATDQAIVLGGTMNSLQVAHIFFLPRDRLGNYLGPGFAQSFEVRSIGAQLVGAITDLENGYYRQTIRYPARGPEPAVTVLMPGTTFKDVIEFHPTPAIFKLLLRWACFIIVVILFALLLWRWRKAASTA